MSLVNKANLKQKPVSTQYCAPPKHLYNEITDGSFFFFFSFKETHHTVLSTFEQVLYIGIQMEKLFV